MTSSAEADLNDLLDQAGRWATEDPDPETRAELERIIADVTAGADPADLADRFAGTLEFGTAGLRGALGAGPRRMNRIVVMRAAAGLAAYLSGLGAGRGGSVVIGYDARHNSDVFARDTAEVITGAGLTALLLPRPLPTPVLAFAIRELGCLAGVMVTASHNPPQDNGYKVYLGDGSQIVPPADVDIAAKIAAVGPLAEVPRSRPYVVLSEEVVDTYLDTVAALADDGPRDLRIVYTPLHGVGAGCVTQVLETAGFDAPHVVPQQEQPDPDFPTVAFPNPEEPGAMALWPARDPHRAGDLCRDGTPLRLMEAPAALLWEPPADARETTEIGRYLAWLEHERGLVFADYDALQRWSVDDLEGFWSSIWEFFPREGDAGTRLLENVDAQALVSGCDAQLRRAPAR